jgi:hypothetical protein
LCIVQNHVSSVTKSNDDLSSLEYNKSIIEQIDVQLYDTGAWNTTKVQNLTVDELCAEFAFLQPAKDNSAIWWCIAFDITTHDLIYYNGKELKLVHYKIEWEDDTPKPETPVGTRPCTVYARHRSRRPRAPQRTPAPAGGMQTGGAPPGTLAQFLTMCRSSKVLPLAIDNFESNTTQVRNISELPASSQLSRLPVEVLADIFGLLLKKDEANLLQTHPAVKPIIDSIPKNVGTEVSAEKEIARREQLYTFLCMLCILERRRLYHSKFRSCITLATQFFIITTSKHPDVKKHPTMYENRIKLLDGSEIVVTDMYHDGISNADILHADEKTIDGLYALIRRKCKTDMTYVVKRLLHTQYVVMKKIATASFTDTIQNLLQNVHTCELNVTPKVVMSLCNDYIDKLQKFLIVCSKGPWRSDAQKISITYVQLLIITTLLVARHVLALVDGSDNGSGNYVPRIRENLDTLKDKIEFYSSVTGTSGETAVEWLKTLNTSEQQNNDDLGFYNIVLYNLFTLIMTVQRALDIGTHTVPDTYHFMIHTTLTHIHVPRLIALKKIKTVTEHNYVECASLLSRIANAEFHTFIPHNSRYRDTLLGLLNTDYTLADTIQSGDDMHLNNRWIKSSSSSFAGIASACLCKQSTLQIDGQTCVIGLADERVLSILSNIETFTDTSKLFGLTFNSVCKEYSELHAMYLVDYYKCTRVTTTVLPPRHSPAQTNVVTEIKTPELPKYIKDLHAKHQAVWDAEHALLDKTGALKSIQSIKLVLSNQEMYRPLFARLRKLYAPLYKTARILDSVYQFIKYHPFRKTKLDIMASVPYKYDTEYEYEYHHEYEDEDEDDTFSGGSDDEDANGISGKTTKIDTHENENENEYDFDTHIRPLLPDSIVKSIALMRTRVFNRPNTNNDGDTEQMTFDLRMLMYEIKSYASIQVANTEAFIEESLISSAMKTVHPRARAALDQGTEESYAYPPLVRSTAVRIMRESNADEFIANLQQCFMVAFFCIPKEIAERLRTYGSNYVENYTAKLAALQNAKSDLANHMSTFSSGGGIHSIASKYALYVTNTETMRTVQKPIFKIGNQSKVRHNGELVLVSKYKLILVKIHNRRVTFAIRAAKRGKQ